MTDDTDTPGDPSNEAPPGDPSNEAPPAASAAAGVAAVEDEPDPRGPWYKSPSFWLMLTVALLWIVASGLIWVSNTWSEAHELVPNGKSRPQIWEPAVVGASLGLSAILTFGAIYFFDPATDGDHRMRSAIAGSVVLLFLLLVVDLLVIAGFRQSLAGTSIVCAKPGTCASPGQALDFVNGMFGTFKWVVVTVVASYFGAGAIEKVSGDRLQAAKLKADAADASKPKTDP